MRKVARGRFNVGDLPTGITSTTRSPRSGNCSTSKPVIQAHARVAHLLPLATHQQVHAIGGRVSERAGVHRSLALAGGLGEPLELDPDHHQADDLQQRRAPPAKREQHHVVDEEVGRLHWAAREMNEHGGRAREPRHLVNLIAQ
jgi:hypothetical protein